jgi:hypothetical protein
MTTFTSTTDGNLADGATYGNTSPGTRGVDFPGDDDVLVVASGDTVTMNADATIGSIDIQGTLTTDGTARTLTLDDGGQGYICEHRGTVSTTINLTINSNYAGNRLIRLNNGGNGNFNDVSITLEASNRVLEFVQSTTIDGNLTILLGKLQPYASTYSLTVTGYASVTGTLTGNASAISLGGLEINSGGTYNATSGTTTITNKNSSNYMFFDSGTFTHNNGTVHFKADTSSGTWYAVKGHSTEDTTEFYNVTTERVGSSVGNYRVCVGGSNQFFTVRNNLTVGANCKIFSSNGSSILRHSGLATLNGELDLDSFTDIEMGAVTINSGGTLEFDNGSITIKAESLRNVGGTINA